MRNHFIKNLVTKAKKNKKIFLLVGDLGFSVVEEFADTYPDRFLNVGIAEQNMMGLAAGLASEGMHVFVYSIANFPTFRCAEQIRNDVDYHNLPVTIVSIGGGFSYGNLGYSHHAIQDYGLLRLMPNMMICSPGDLNETTNALEYILDNPQPSYIRLDKSFNENLRSQCPKIKPGKWILFRESNSKKVILTTGNTLRFHDRLTKMNEFKNYSIYSLPIWGHKFKNTQTRMLKKFNNIVTIEDHLLDAGFGSWVKECTSLNLNPKIRNIGLSSKYISHVGNQDYLNKKSGLFFV
jgi:transketolase